MTYNEKIKQILDNLISDMASNKEDYVKNPGVDFVRNRKLPFEMVIKLILSMKGGSLNKELYDFFGRTPESIVTSSAFIQQRDKLNENVFVDLFHNFNKQTNNLKSFRGYKLYAVDGSDINIAYNKDSDTYIDYSHKDEKEGYKGVNQIHLNAVYDLLNKVYVNALLTPKSKLDERRDFIQMLESMELNQKTLFIADRGYPSWNMFAHFKYKKYADYLIRVQNGGTKLVKNLPMIEFDIKREITITTKTAYKNTDGYIYVHVKKNKMKNREYTGGASFVDWDFGEFEKLNLRIVRFKITEDTYETIITSLPKDKFSIEDIKKLYGMRWGIETSFRELKYVIGLTNLHCKKESFVRQEVYAKLIMYNFCEKIISAVVVEQDENKKHNYQINYTMAMRICLDFYRALVDTFDVYDLMLKYIEAVRPGRKDKRKMRSKSFVCFTYRVAA